MNKETHSTEIEQNRGIHEYGQYTYFDKDLNMNCIDLLMYVNFFTERIQRYEDLYLDGTDKEPVRMYEGTTMEEFLNKYAPTPELGLDRVNEIFQWYCTDAIKDDSYIDLQKELEKEGKQVSLGNALLLSKFIREKAGNRYFLLLKPTYKEIKEELTSLGKVSQIVLTGSNNKTIKFDHSEVIKNVLSTIEEQINHKEETLEIGRIAKWDDLSNKSIMQSIFVHDFTQFLHMYFPDGKNRKRGALISTVEQKLVCKMMCEVGLSPVPVSGSRYRQLLLMYNTIDYSPTYHRFPPIGTNEKRLTLACNFLPWSIWKEKDIDWTKPLESDFLLGKTFKFALSMG